MTAKEQKMLNNYNNAKTEALHQAYARPSAAKWQAYQNCLRRQADYAGYNGKITGYNTSTFSYAFLYRDSAKILHLHYITAQNEYDFIID